MSQSSRADRRRQTRGGITPPPRRTDPMRAIYIGAAIVVVLVIGAFAFMNWQTSRQFAAANATPTPGPNATAKAIQLADGESLGAKSLVIGNTRAGGHGQPVDGITCGAMEFGALHVHTHLALFVNGKQMQIPQFIGMAPSANGGGCLYWLHTHDASGILHVEAPQINAPNGGPYTLGMFFDIWGQPLQRDAVATFKGPVVAYVNGAPWTGDLRAIPLGAHQEITLEVGTPTVPPPNYTFPPAD
jgi:hypothetical protein